MKSSAIQDCIAKLVIYLYGFKTPETGVDDSVIKSKIDYIKEHFDLSRSTITEVLGEENINFIKNNKFLEKFEQYDEYLIERDFWTDKNISNLVKTLEKDIQDVSQKDVSTIRKLVDYIFKGKEGKEPTAAVKESPTGPFDITTFDPYTFFTKPPNANFFIHSLLLKKHKIKGSFFELDHSRFRLVANTFQFICLSSQ